MTIFDKAPRALVTELISSTRAAVADPLPRGQRWKLAPIVGSIALSGYALSFWLGDPALLRMLVWFVGAAVAHDLLLFPLYALLDEITHAVHLHLPRTRVPLINHIRVPALAAGLTLLMFLPGIIAQGTDTFRAATGLDQSPYLGRWLWLVAAMFAASAAIWIIRAVRARTPVRAALPIDDERPLAP